MTKGNGIHIDCKTCRYLKSDACGGFDISVDINDSQTGVAGQATLHCDISGRNHRLELFQWQPAESFSAQPNTDLVNRVTATLDVFAEQRLCGNSKICPTALVRAIEGENWV